MLFICRLFFVDPWLFFFFFFQAEDGIRDHCVTGVQTCALPIFTDRFQYERDASGAASLQSLSVRVLEGCSAGSIALILKSIGDAIDIGAPLYKDRKSVV